MISHIYSKSHLLSSAKISHIINGISQDRVLPAVQRCSEHSELVDVYSFFSGVGMDFITAYVFGARNATNIIKDEEERNAWRVKYSVKWKMAFWSQELPALKDFLESLGVNFIRPWMSRSKEEVEHWCMKMCLRAEADMRSSNASDTDNTVYAYLWQSMERASKRADDQVKEDKHRNTTDQVRRNAVASEIMDHISMNASFTITSQTVIIILDFSTNA